MSWSQWMKKTKKMPSIPTFEFGTAGMRGLIGAGTNRINIYVVRQATEGLAQLIDSKGEEAKKRGVAIAYDSRHFSPEFALNLLKFWLHTESNLMYLKAYVNT